MELRILSDEETVEPSLDVSPRREAPPPRPSLSARLQATSLGRAIHGCMQWVVVLGLILSGYVFADVLNAGVRHALGHDAGNTAAPMLAASASHE
jgi:hypothetical protein